MPRRFFIAVKVRSALWSIAFSIFGKKKEKKMRKSKKRIPRTEALALHREHIYGCGRNTFRYFTPTVVDVTLECHMPSYRVAIFLFTHLFLQTEFLGKEVAMIQ
jgi:hypothetical protein